MELLFNFLAGIILVPIYNGVKGVLGLKDKSAAWVLLIITLFLSFPIALTTGALQGIELDLTNPVNFLESVAKGFLVLLGTAEGLYMLVKDRKK